MIPWYRNYNFWTLIVGAIAELVIGFGFPDQAALLASVAGTVMAALVAGGIVMRANIQRDAELRKAEIQAQADYAKAYDAGFRAKK